MNPLQRTPFPVARASLLGAAALLVAVGLSACGGGGQAASPPAPPPGPPKIVASVSTLFSPDAQTSSNYVTQATVQVSDGTGSPITTAQVTADGVPLPYVTADQDYEGTLSIKPGDTIMVAATVNGTTYSASHQNLGTFPAVISPADGTFWSAQPGNLISWSGAVPDSSSVYAVGMVSIDGGGLVWPAQGGYEVVTPPQSSTTVDATSVPAGSYYVLVGIVDYVPFQSAAAGSDLVIGGFAYSSVAVIAAPPMMPESLAIAPASTTVGVGKSLQLTAKAVYGDGSSPDVTTVAAWSSSDPTKVTVSNLGLITGVAGGTATVTAQYQGVSSTASINVFALNPSPQPPLTQAVAYQIDYAHTGRVTVGSGGPVFPPTAHWSVTLNGSSTSYPLIADGKVFVTNDLGPGPTPDAMLYAIDEETGDIVWGPTPLPQDSYYSALAYDHGTLFVVTNAGVLSFDGATGTPGWSNLQLSTYPLEAPPTAVNGIVYIDSTEDLVAMDETNGNILFSTHATLDAASNAAPAVSADGVFLSYACSATKQDPVVGTVLWLYATDCSSAGGNTPVYANSQVYARGISTLEMPTAPGRILDAGTGAQVGTFAADVIPAFSDTAGFFLSQGTLSAIDSSTQETLWSFNGDGNLVSAPIVIDSVVVIASSSGTVYALDAASGSVLWSGSAGAAISAPQEGNQILTGIGAGEGYLVVPAGNVLNGWRVIP